MAGIGGMGIGGLSAGGLDAQAGLSVAPPPPLGVPVGGMGGYEAEDGIQLSVKINDHNSNGGTRYKGWAFHREAVIKRLGWRLLHSGLDYATFVVPQAHLAPADRERRARVPKEERQFWSDKNDFCRCLEVVLDEAMGKLSRKQRTLLAERGEGPKRGRKRKLDILGQDSEGQGLVSRRKGLVLSAVQHLIPAELTPMPPPPGICGGSAGALGLNGGAGGWSQLTRHSQAHLPTHSLHTDDSDIGGE